jgi:hypothetical protein
VGVACAVALFAIVVLSLSATTVVAHSLKMDLVCSEANLVHNPKPYMDLLLPAPRLYNGLTVVNGSVFQHTSDEFDRVRVGRLSGIFQQGYDDELGTYVAHYYLDIAGQEWLVATMTFVQLRSGEFVHVSEFCLKYTPDDLAPQFQRVTPMADNFFYGTYYNKRVNNDGTVEGTYGNVARTEYFYSDPAARLDAPGLESINCLTDFNKTSANIDTETCFRYTKISNNPVRCSNPEGSNLRARSAAEVAPREEARPISEYPGKKIDLGKGLLVPLDVIFPEHRHLYAARAA